MIERSILIFPCFDNMEKIQWFREKHDPVYKNIGPHISLVFPFKSDISKEQLKEKIVEAKSGIKPFKVSFRGGKLVEGGIVFLKLVEGKSELLNLHKKLYEGLLRGYQPEFLKTVEYEPHITIGRYTEDNLQDILRDFSVLEEDFETIVYKISMEIIADNLDSIIELEINL